MSIKNQIFSLLKNYKGDNGFYIVELNKVKEQFQKWKKNMPNVIPHYAIKCNPDKEILNLINNLGINFDCASKGEIESLAKFNVNPKRIIFANPCKAISEIEFAKKNNINLFTFDDINELEKINKIFPSAELIVRIKTDDRMSECRFSEKFGAELDDLDKIFKYANENKMKIVGVSFHVGSNCYDIETYQKTMDDVKKVFDLSEKYGFCFSMLDIGGGFPANDDKLKFEIISKTINENIEKYFLNNGKYKNLKVIAEPGRFMVSTSHTLVLNIIGKKEYFEQNAHTNKLEKKFKYYLNDGMYGSFNCIYFDHAKPEIIPLEAKETERYKSIIFGPTCDAMDTISNETILPELNVGDWVYIENFGAYTNAAGSNFNGFEKPRSIYI